MRSSMAPSAGAANSQPRPIASALDFVCVSAFLHPPIIDESVAPACPRQAREPAPARQARPDYRADGDVRPPRPPRWRSGRPDRAARRWHPLRAIQGACGQRACPFQSLRVGMIKGRPICEEEGTIHPHHGSRARDRAGAGELLGAVARDADVGRRGPRARAADRSARPPDATGRVAAGIFGRAMTARCAPPDSGAVLQRGGRDPAGGGPGDRRRGAASAAMIGDVLGGELHRKRGRGRCTTARSATWRGWRRWPDLPSIRARSTPRGRRAPTEARSTARSAIDGCTVAPGDLVIGDGDGLAALRPERSPG